MREIAIGLPSHKFFEQLGQLSTALAAHNPAEAIVSIVRDNYVEIVVNDRMAVEASRRWEKDEWRYEVCTELVELAEALNGRGIVFSVNFNAEIKKVSDPYSQRHFKVVSAFPGVGKSHLFDINHKLGEHKVLDSDSSKFPKDLFPANYIQHIEGVLKLDADRALLVSSHDTVRATMRQRNIDYLLVYPALECKDEYIQRYINRGSPASFIDLLIQHFDTWVKSCEADPTPSKIVLKPGQFLSDVITYNPSTRAFILRNDYHSRELENVELLVTNRVQPSGVFYPTEAVRKVIESERFQRRVSTGRLLGEFGQPRQLPTQDIDEYRLRVATIDEKNVSHVFSKVFMDEDGVVRGTVKPVGPQAAAFMDCSGYRFALRGFSHLSARDDHSEAFDLQVVTFDIVNHSTDRQT